MKLSYSLLGSEGYSAPNDDWSIGEAHQKYMYLLLGKATRSNRLPIRQHDGWTITGNGQVGSDRCGQVSSAYHKLGSDPKDKKNWRPLVYHCHRQDCPICNPQWAERLGKAVAVNLHLKAMLTHSRLHHDIISWSYEHYDNAKASAEFFNAKHEGSDDFKARDVWDYLELRLRTLLEYLHEGSIPLGYMYVHHPYSLACNVCGEALDKENNDKVPIKCPSCDSEFSFIWRFHPHTHLITNSWTRIRTVRAQEALDGDVYKNIRSLSMNSFTGLPKERLAAHLDCIKKLVRYEVSHALSRPGRHVLAYAGSFANVNFRVDESTVNFDYTDGDNTPFAKTFLKRMDGGAKIVMKTQNKPVYTLADGKLVYLQEFRTTVHMYLARVLARHKVPEKTQKCWREYLDPKKKKLRKIQVGEVTFPAHYKNTHITLSEFRAWKNGQLGQTKLDDYFKKLPTEMYLFKGKPVPLTRTRRLPKNVFQNSPKVSVQ